MFVTSPDGKNTPRQRLVFTERPLNSEYLTMCVYQLLENVWGGAIVCVFQFSYFAFALSTGQSKRKSTKLAQPTKVLTNEKRGGLKLACHKANSNIAIGLQISQGKLSHYLKRFMMVGRFLPSSHISARMYNFIVQYRCFN